MLRLFLYVLRFCISYLRNIYCISNRTTPYVCSTLTTMRSPAARCLTAQAILTTIRVVSSPATSSTHRQHRHTHWRRISSHGMYWRQMWVTKVELGWKAHTVSVSHTPSLISRWYYCDFLSHILNCFLVATCKSSLKIKCIFKNIFIIFVLFKWKMGLHSVKESLDWRD